MTGQESGRPGERLVQIITYDHLKQAYIHLEKLRLISYKDMDSSFLKELSKHEEIRRRIVEHFEMLKPNELQRIQYSEEPDELNMEAITEVLADPVLRAKSKVYDSFFINERD